MTKEIDDYDLFDLDFDEFVRRGLEELAAESEDEAA